jgi:hypothetical protein
MNDMFLPIVLIDTIGRVGTITNTTQSVEYTVRQEETNPNQSKVKEGETRNENVF